MVAAVTGAPGVPRSKSEGGRSQRQLPPRPGLRARRKSPSQPWKPSNKIYGDLKIPITVVKPSPKV